MKSPKTAIMFFAKALGYEKHLKSISKDSADYERNIALVNEFADLFMNYKFMEPLEEYANMLKKTIRNRSRITSVNCRTVLM